MKFHNFGYLLKEGVKNLWKNRTMSIASIGVLISCLLLPGCASLVSINLTSMMSSIEDNNSITVYLTNGLPSLSAVQVGDQIRSIENVSECTFVPKDDGLADMMDLLGENAVVLDIGFGTGTLTAKLYERGCSIYGQDFSSRMIALASEKMPNAHLYQGDFSKGLVEPLRSFRYDYIVATYSLHHLTDAQKSDFILDLRNYLKENGKIIIGDIAFETRKELEQCKLKAGDTWDNDEIYFVVEELRKDFPDLSFTQMSDCAGVLILD